MPRTKCGPLHDLCRLTKAFDAVNRDEFWKIMSIKVYTIAMVLQFHDNTLARVRNDREYTEPFTESSKAVYGH